MASNTTPYDDNFYKQHIDWQKYYKLISDWIYANTTGAIYGDVGCGNGYLIRNLKKDGKIVWGVDGSEAFMRHVDKSIREDVKRVDLAKKHKLQKSDVVMCLEVAEHIDEKYADILINNIISTDASTIIFTAATPGQGGTDHINLKPHRYWIEKLQAVGYCLDRKLSNKFIADLNEELTGCRWYLDNMMIFRKKNRNILLETGSRFINNLKLCSIDRFQTVNKRNSELIFWQNEIKRYEEWYKEEIGELYGLRLPSRKITNYNDLAKNAVFTFIKADKNRYINHLGVDKLFFKGLKVLEVGCGPLPNSLVFEDCQIVGLDPLINRYKEAGYPLDEYSSRISYVNSKAERMPFKNESFDAALSVNAIDHVDDFMMTAHEIQRVLKPKGRLLIETHYHKARECEPVELNDKKIIEAFSDLKMKKLSEKPFWDFYPDYGEKEERLVVWLGEK